MKLEKNLAARMYGHTTDGFYVKITMMGKRKNSIMNRIYFEALVVTIKMGKGLDCIFFVV